MILIAFMFGSIISLLVMHCYEVIRDRRTDRLRGFKYRGGL